MDEIRIPTLICDYLGGCDCGAEFVPEVWRDGYAAVWLSGGGECISEYIDGSSIVSVPFEVRIRCDGQSIGDRLDAVSFFACIADYIDSVPMEQDGCSIRQTNGAQKSSVYDDGSEEYRAAYELRYFKNAPRSV